MHWCPIIKGYVIRGMHPGDWKCVSKEFATLFSRGGRGHCNVVCEVSNEDILPVQIGINREDFVVLQLNRLGESVEVVTGHRGVSEARPV